MIITLIYNNEKFELGKEKKIDESISLTLAQAIFWSGCVPARPLCAGIASCGRCKVKFLSQAPKLTATEEKILTQIEKETNIRLACRHQAKDGMFIELLPDNTVQKQKKSTPLLKYNKNAKPATSQKPIDKYRLFVDIGTTSIAWHCESIANLSVSVAQVDNTNELENLPTFSGGALNPQMIAGADVMARLHSANALLIKAKKSPFLHNLIQNYLQELIKELQDSSSSSFEIVEIFMAANSAVMALSLGTDISGLCSAPYVLADFGNRYVTLESLPPIWIAPQMSAFIGADACSGLAYILSLIAQENGAINDSSIDTIELSKNTNHEKTFDKYQGIIFLLADMGTNGEFILFDGTEKKPKITAASVPLGPAIEGVGMRFGAPVHGEVQNIILSFKLGLRGLEYQCSGIPKHICGAAYLSLIHILLSLNLLNRQGFFQIPSRDDLNSSSTYTQIPLAKKILQNIREENGETRLYITDILYICPEDIENILKVKSAFATAISLLTQEALEGKSMTNIYLSGSLADYIPLTHLENLGFIHQGASKYTKILGNSSLKGLQALAKSEPLKEELLDFVKNAKTLDLTADPIFAEEFIENMHF